MERKKGRTDGGKRGVGPTHGNGTGTDEGEDMEKGCRRAGVQSN